MSHRTMRTRRIHTRPRRHPPQHGGRQRTIHGRFPASCTAFSQYGAMSVRVGTSKMNFERDMAWGARSAEIRLRFAGIETWTGACRGLSGPKFRAETAVSPGSRAAGRAGGAALFQSSMRPTGSPHPNRSSTDYSDPMCITESSVFILPTSHLPPRQLKRLLTQS